MKKYRSIKIRNPLSMQHIARVKPGQVIEITLDEKTFPASKLEFSSDKFILERAVEKGDSITYIIKTNEYYDFWSNYSSCLMGDIFIDSLGSFCKIIVILDCLNVKNNNVLTVVNPEGDDVRIKSNDILECVVYSKNYFSDHNWDWLWSPTEPIGALIVKQDSFFSYGNLTTKITDENKKYPTCNRLSQSETGKRQNHFWFSFSNLDQIKETSLNLGNMKIFTVNNEDYSFDFNLTIDNKKVKKMNMKDYFKTKSYIPCNVEKINKYYDCSSEVNVIKNNLYQNQNNKLNEVEIKFIETSLLGQDCKEISALEFEDENVENQAFSYEGIFIDDHTHFDLKASYGWHDYYQRSTRPFS